MDFGLSPEQIALQDSINRYLDENVSLDTVRAFACDGDYREIWRGLADLGASALLQPEEDGGAGLTVLDAALVAECLGAHVARLEMQVAYKHLLPRIEEVELVGPPARLRSALVGGIKHLPIRYKLRAA